MKALTPNIILRFKKPEYVNGRPVVEVSILRKFLCFEWRSKFRRIY